MMPRLIARAETIGRSERRRRLQRIAEGLQSTGMAVEIGSDSVSCRGRGAVRRWLTDPLVRFAGTLNI